jgi:large subunit ribosomal protein L21
MYAIIRTGGKQSKVHEGDIIDVERLRAEGEVTFIPVLVVDDKGKVFSSRQELSTAKVTAKVLGESAGEKIDIFKYKAKTGYRRRGGHRQRYTQIEVTKIQLPKGAKAAPAASDEDVEASEAEKKPAAKKPAAKPAEKKPAAKPAEKKPAAKPAEKKPAAKPAEKKPAAKPAEKKPAAKKPAAKKETAATAEGAEDEEG